MNDLMKRYLIAECNATFPTYTDIQAAIAIGVISYGSYDELKKALMYQFGIKE